tara:strand:+ start:951 stop:1589 length:639 start_codon:yes stop_codon:yes gene_type:complete
MEQTENQQTQTETYQSFGAPIAGQSLTNSPENPAPFEQAPEHTALHPTLEYIWGDLIQPEYYIATMQLINNQEPIMDITEMYLMNGFQEGKWNPDLMMMLVEPVAYMLVALAERLDIDFVVYEDEEEESFDGEQSLFGMDLEQQKFENLLGELKRIPEGTLTKDIEQNLNSPVTELERQVKEQLTEKPSQQESLMEKPKESLMSKPIENEEE